MKTTLFSILTFLALSTLFLPNVFAQDLSCKKLTGHTGTVNSVTFSPDGATLASGSEYGCGMGPRDNIKLPLSDIRTRSRV